MNLISPTPHIGHKAGNPDSCPTVMVVDDVPENLIILGTILKRHYRVITAESGEAALQLVGRARPDLILLDIMLPDMDGYAVLCRLKADPDTKDIPVILITSLDSVDNEEYGLRLGAADYITKPIRAAIVLARSRVHLDLKMAHDRLSAEMAWTNVENDSLREEVARDRAAHAAERDRAAKDERIRMQSMIDHLTRSNRQLARFAEIAAHDLQEPVRSIVSFGQLLERRYKEQLAGEGSEFLAHMTLSAKRLHQQINDLLVYSRTEMPEDTFNPVDCDRAVESALANLRFSIECSNAKISVGEMACVNGQRAPLITLFQNLIGNAIKFRKPEERPIISVASTQTGDGVTFKVSDNGIGVPLQYREQVFEIFKRLHPPQAYPGTGIGLAICRRIVENHGGAIWIEDGQDGGSCVCFTLPMAA